MTKITSSLLRAKGACSEQVELFKSLDGDSLELTEALCLEHAEKFNWGWAAHNLLSRKALDKYNHAMDVAWTEYENIEDLARAKYNYTVTSAPGKPTQVMTDVLSSALAEYNRVVDPAFAKRNHVRASTFFKLWKEEN